MLPTQILTGTNATGQTITRKRSFVDLITRSNAASPAAALRSKDVMVMAGLAVPVLGAAMALL